MDRLVLGLLRVQAWLRGLADARDDQLQVAWQAGALAAQRYHAMREEELRLEALRDAVGIAVSGRGGSLGVQADLRESLWKCGLEDLQWTPAHVAGGTDLDLLLAGLVQRLGAASGVERAGDP